MEIYWLRPMQTTFEPWAYSTPAVQYASTIPEIFLECVHPNFNGWLHLKQITMNILPRLKGRYKRIGHPEGRPCGHTTRKVRQSKGSIFHMFLVLVFGFFGEAVFVNLCKWNDHVFKKVISELRTKLSKLFREPVSSMPEGSSINPMIPICFQQWSPIQNYPTTVVQYGSK